MKTKKLNSRQKEIIKILTKSTVTNPLTTASIAEKLSISSRTVLREMPKIEVWLEENEFKFIKKPGVGLVIDESLENQKLILELLEIEKIEKEYSKEERKKIVISELLISQEPIKLFYFTSLLKVSEGTLSNDLDSIEEWLRKFNIKLVRKPGLGIYVEGKEDDYRKALTNILYDTLEEKELINLLKGSLMTNKDNGVIEFSIENRLLNFIDKAIIKSIEEIVGGLEKENDIKLVDSAYIGLVVHLSLAIQRIKNKENIKMDKEVLDELSKLPEFKIGERLVRNIEKKFNIEIPVDEIGYITMHLKGAKLRLNSISELENDIANLDIKSISIKIIEVIEKELSVFLKDDEKLLKDLTNHLVPAINRLKMKMNIRNPLLKNIKQKYPMEYIATKKACEILKISTNVEEIPEPEIAYITMHIAAAIYKKGFEEKIKVVISCPTGIGTSSLLAAILEKEFNNVTVADTISAININEDRLKEEQVDLIVSTVPLEIDFKNICVDPILSIQDKAVLQDNFRKILKQKKYKNIIKKVDNNKKMGIREITEIGNEILLIVDNVQVKEINSANNVEELIYEASYLFTDKINEAEEIRNNILSREKINSTYIEDLGILLLHCKCKCLDGGRFGYLKTTNNFNYEKGSISGALVSIIPENPKEITSQLISKINGAVIEDENFLRSLNEENSKEVSIRVEKILKEIFIKKIQMSLEG
ncbi:transcription antiterminator [Clostridium sp. AL.422]|uniref:transcription antiterminator n=1 Tax=Clostridium TaxID=1485 RepID=UPI00293DC094|nr:MULTISPECIES: transcription antiterminator [unclassified Clostridium]MDV4149269.1 transcription antiterminator [Clostridium sp. AL.422]